MGRYLITWIEKLNIIKMSLLASLLSIFNVIQTNFQQVHLWRLKKPISKFLRRDNKTILGINKSGGLAVLDFKTYCGAVVIRTVGYWRKSRQIGEWTDWRDQKQTRISPANWCVFKEQRQHSSMEQRSFPQVGLPDLDVPITTATDTCGRRDSERKEGEGGRKTCKIRAGNLANFNYTYIYKTSRFNALPL